MDPYPISYTENNCYEAVKIPVYCNARESANKIKGFKINTGTVVFVPCIRNERCNLVDMANAKTTGELQVVHRC